MCKEIGHLNLPEVEPVQYERNFIRTAVCELKFPIILEWEDHPPVSVQKELRKEYPYHKKVQSIDIDPQHQKSQANIALNLQSKNKNWTVSIRPDAIALETRLYKNFEEFHDKLKKIVAVVDKKIDADFFTRVGLRYINVIHFADDEFGELLNPDLVAPILKNIYGSVKEFYQHVNGNTEYGLYNFRHGIKPNEKSEREYFLDFDYFKEGVEIGDALELVKNFHEYNFKFFHWTLGKKAFDQLGKPTPKKKV